MKNLGNWLDARTDYRRLIAPLRQRTIPGGPGWWLTSGSCLFWLLVTELVTGLALMTTYSPSMAAAWASVHFIDASAAGAVLRGVHYYTSHALIVIFLVHVARVVWSAAFRAPRELIWMTGLLLMPLTIVWALTGNPLSANQKGMGQIEVEGKILASTPWIGPAIQRILIGGDAPGNLTLTHLYFLHVGLLPLLAGLLLAVHISQVYRHGLSPRGQQPPGGPAVAYWPHQSVRNLVVLSLVMAVVVWLAWRYGAPLDAPADPNLPQSPRPEWYFRWLFELRRVFHRSLGIPGDAGAASGLAVLFSAPAGGRSQAHAAAECRSAAGDGHCRHRRLGLVDVGVAGTRLERRRVPGRPARRPRTG